MIPTEQFHRYLHEHCDGRVRVGLNVLLHAFQKVYPELSATPSARGRLRELLDQLQFDERIELPKGGEHWDYSALPALPRWVKLPRETMIEEKADIRSIPWSPELRFLASARVCVPLQDLFKLQEFFAGGGRAKPLVPIKERSLEIFGDEKRLDQLMRGSALFGNGRLAPETLRCVIVPEPLSWTRGPHHDGPALVIENAATWYSYCRWNAERRFFSAVVYGCGNRFADGVRYLADL